MGIGNRDVLTRLAPLAFKRSQVDLMATTPTTACPAYKGAPMNAPGSPVVTPTP